IIWLGYLFYFAILLQVSPEDKGVDLYVLERAMISTHVDSEEMFKSVLEGYKSVNQKQGIAVLNSHRVRHGLLHMNKKHDAAQTKRGNPPPSGLVSGRMYLTKVAELSEEFNVDAYHISDILQIIRPQLSIHFNFAIDIEWLIRQYPMPCRDSPIQCVVGEKMGSDKRSLSKDVSTLKFENVSVLGAPLPIPFGTHHTKLSMFDCEAKLHVIVSTANLIEGDWCEKTQCFYYACGIVSDTR
ncbi:hypothetical protein OSTOST_10583, partial [Ostertagia ostertagi]